MTPTPTAATADTQVIWPQDLPINRGGRSSTHSAASTAHSLPIDILRSAPRYLQAGWRWLERKRTQQLSSRRLRLAETISLGDKRSVSIVQVDGAQFLIGCTSGSIQLLAMLDNKRSGDTAGASEIERVS